MSVAAIKRPPPDPLRVALAEAVENAAEAKAALQAQTAAVTKLRRAVLEAERAHETAERGVKEALRNAGAEMALAAADDDDIAPGSSTVLLARAAVVNAADHVEVCRATVQAVKDRVRDYSEAVRWAEDKVETAIAAVVAPHEARLKAEIAEAEARMRALYSAWAALSSTNGDARGAIKARLRADPHADLDDLLALPASAPRPPAA